MSTKTYLDQNVYDAAVERINFIFDHFKKLYLSFSGGKDSGLLLNLVIQEAKKRGRLPIDVLYIDFEAQYQHTIDFIERMMKRPEVRPWWVALPLHLRNAVSQYQPHWLCWDPGKKDLWVRNFPKAKGVITDEKFFPFFYRGMEFEEFVPKFAKWFSDGEPTACLVAIRSDESLNRFRTIKNTAKETLQGKMWSTRISETVYNFYPIYDWKTRDIWIANGKFRFDSNRVYDLMYLAGLSIHQMRLCQPYGDDQRKGLWLFKILEPEMWSKVVQRVEGANFGNRYTERQGYVIGNYKIKLPKGYTYEKYAKFLSETIPPYVWEHYEKKINKFLSWWAKHGYEKIPDYADPKLEAKKKVPSWRRICKVLLKNDYWCRGLSFSETKKEMQKEMELVTKYITKEAK